MVFVERPLGYHSSVIEILTSSREPDLAHDSLGNGLRNLDVVARLHYILAAALGLGTKVIGVTEHLRKRNKCSNLNGTISGLLVLDLSTSGVEVADYVTDVIIRNDNVNTHDRLEDYGVSRRQSATTPRKRL